MIIIVKLCNTIVGGWNCTIFFPDNATISVYQKVEVIKKHGLDYINPVRTNTTIHVGGPKVNVKFDGNSELGEYIS